MTSRAVRSSRWALALGLITTIYGILGCVVSLPIWTGIVTLCSLTGCALSVAALSSLPEEEPFQFLLRRGAVLLSLMLCLWPWVLLMSCLWFRGEWRPEP